MKKVLLVACSIIGLTLSGCKTNEDVSFEELETQRGIDNDNSLFNAQKWRAEHNLSDKEIYARGDSTQARNCPQGDGWASIDLLNKQTKAVEIRIKCSTVSGNLGCMEESDFKTKRFATEENKCNPDLPVRLPKLQK